MRWEKAFIDIFLKTSEIGGHDVMMAKIHDWPGFQEELNAEVGCLDVLIIE